MKRLLYLLSFLPFVAGFSQENSIAITDLREGEVNQVDSILIPDNSVAEARNVYFDDVAMVKKRKGMTKINSSALGGGEPIYNQFEFKKSNGTTYQIVVSSTSLYYRTGGATFTQFKADMSTTTSITNFEVFMDTLQFCNGVANLQYWNTSTVATTTTAYQPKYIRAWQNRLCIAGDTDEPSSLRMSKYLDPQTWTVPASNTVATDPVLFDINSQDGQKIIGIEKSPNGNLLILKEKSAWEISGTDRDDFVLRLVSPDLGCINGGSFAYKEGKAIWLSSEGFVEYDGNIIKIISKPIQNTIDNIQQLRVGKGSFQKNTNTEWNTFSSTSFIDTTSNPGSITNALLTTYTDLTSNISDFTGELFKIDNKYYAIKSYSDGIYCDIMSNGKFLSHNLIKTGSNTQCLLPLHLNSTWGGSLEIARVDTNNKIHLIFLDKISNSYWIKYSTSTDGITWVTESVYNLNWSNQNNYASWSYSLDLDSNNNPNIVFNPPNGTPPSSSYFNIDYLYRTGYATWSLVQDIGGDSTRDFTKLSMNIDSNNKMNIICWNYQAPTRIWHIFTSTGSTAASSTNTNTSINVNGTFGISSVLNSNNKIYFAAGYILGTNESGGWVSSIISNYASNSITFVRIGSNNYPQFGYHYYNAPIQKVGYIFYNSTSTSFSQEYTVDTNNVSIDAFTVDNTNYPALLFIITSSSDSIIYTSTGSYISEIWDTGQSGGVTFDLFNTQETDNNFSVNHYLRTSTSSTTITSSSWNNITKNTIPSFSGYRYLQYRIDISSNVLTNVLPLIDDVIINYHASAGSHNPYSINYKQRIYSAVAISSGTVNDRIVVYDSNDKWTELTSAINCMSLGIFNGDPYFGNDTGFIYQMDTTESDDGNPIDAYILTKTFSLNPYQYKNLNKLFVLADDSGDWNLNLQYYLDRNSTANESFAIDLNQTSGLINYKVPLLKNDPFGLIQFKLYNSNANEPFDLYGLFGFYSYQPLR